MLLLLCQTIVIMPVHMYLCDWQHRVHCTSRESQSETINHPGRHSPQREKKTGGGAGERYAKTRKGWRKWRNRVEAEQMWAQREERRMDELKTK